MGTPGQTANTAAATGPAMTTRHIVKMPRFSGHPTEHLDSWLAQGSIRFLDLAITSDEDKVLFMIKNTKEWAMEWMAPIIQTYTAKPNHQLVGITNLNAIPPVKAMWLNYEHFIEWMQLRHGKYADKKKEAINQIEHVVQGKGRVMTYNAKFDEIVLNVGSNYGSDAILYNYIRGLEGWIKDKISAQPDMQNYDLARWQQMAINIEHNRELLKQSQQTYQPRYGPARQVEYRPAPPRDPDAMDVDTMRTGKKPQGKKNLTCFNCNKPGHFARNCHLKRKNSNTPNRGNGKGRSFTGRQQDVEPSAHIEEVTDDQEDFQDPTPEE